MKIAIIGVGAIGGAVAEGMLRGGIAPQDMVLANPSQGKLQRFSEMGVKCTASNREAVEGADVVIVAVKPWIFPSVIEELKPHLNYATQHVGALVAGVSGADIMKMMRSAEGLLPALSIVMPNTAAAVAQSMTFVAPLHGDATPVVEALRSVGEVMTVEERLLPAATSLASCGIAFALRYIRAATEGGVELGFRATEAQRIVAQTVAGAAALLLTNPGAHAEAEIDKVTTPGGLTIRGLNAMEHSGFTSAVVQGLKASCK